MVKEIAIIGNDLRSNYLKKMYEDDKYSIIENYKYCNNIITSIPFSRDSIYLTGTDIKIDNIIEFVKEENKDITIISGGIKEDIKNLLITNNVKYIDLLDFEDIAILNNIPTAEGAIYVAMEKTNITLCNSKCLILGYGRIGKILSKMLNGIGSNVYVEARKDSDLAWIKAMGYTGIHLDDIDKYLNEFDYIFNTIPSVILDKDRIDLLKKDVCIIDLASSYGLDYEYAKELGLNVNIALGLPSKVAPYTAAKYLKDKIDTVVNN